MATLAETIKQLKNKRQAPQASQQAGLQQLATTAATGKALQSAGPKASNVGEQRAIAAARTAGQQQQVGTNIGAGQLQAAQQQQQQQSGLAQQEQQQKFQNAFANLASQGRMQQREQQQRQDLGQQQLRSGAKVQSKDMANKYQQSLDRLSSSRNLQQKDLFTQFERSNRELEDRKDAAQLEQVAHMMSMQDTAYVNELQRVWDQRNLEDQLEFKRQAQQTIFGDDLDAVIKAADFNIEMAKNKADLNRELAAMDIDTAIQMARAEAKQQAISSIIKGGGELYTASRSKDPQPTPTAEKTEG